MILPFLEESARKYPDQPCTIFKGAVITYREMSAITDHIAAALVDTAIDWIDMNESPELNGAEHSHTGEYLSRFVRGLRRRAS
jgi:hypothetical protein